MANIRDEIVAARRERVARLGFDEGAAVPPAREVPLTPFLGANGLICEVKRRSPSKGDIAPGLDAVAQAGIYVGAGAGNISVLTVPEGFAGSLDDLMAVKRRYPGAAVLRKDFLFDVQDVDVAYRAGADAVLLITGMLSNDMLAAMHARATSLGMVALVEIHDDDDLAKARRIKPNLVGINSRDLTTFRVDPLLPVKVKSGIDWDARVIYESGISSPDGAAFAVGSGFAGILIGEGVVRNPALAPKLLEAMASAQPSRFWPAVGKALATSGGKPLVKMCGLTNADDARLAADLGADLLGFVFWPDSKRAAPPALLEEIQDIAIPKVAVTVNAAGAAGLDPDVLRLLENGLVDAVQFHGDESPDDCARLWPIGYKALCPSTPEQAADAAAYRCPRVLVDAASDLPGGSGKRVRPDVVAAWPGPLWLAGGLGPDTVASAVAGYRPELVDVASGVEASPGKKSPEAMRRFFSEIRQSQ